jgi:hypothetical protein
MREMQSRVYDSRQAQYLLVKAPPASGKSRALMFVALDKIRHQGLKKVIIAVPERSIASSFASTNLTDGGFEADWKLEPRFDLTTSDGIHKTKAFGAFLADSEAKILLCTHATLRFAYEDLGADAFANCLVAIDEFHHTSADADNKLGELVRGLIAEGHCHLIAMTGSYFRGDEMPVLRPEDEEKFTRVTFTYYEQLAGYRHLKTLGIGYTFYDGSYLDSIGKVLDTNRKTILHIPSVNSAASAQIDKNEQVDRVMDTLCGGDTSSLRTDPITGFDIITLENGRPYIVANLVDDEPKRRDKVIAALRSIREAADDRDKLDLIIALGMAKEGFDWVWCEHVLTIGYRSSMTEVIQIIGRTTRDAPGKNHASFTNFVANPADSQQTVVGAVNTFLKAISVSLIMENVLAPNFNFRTKPTGSTGNVEPPSPNVPIEIAGFANPSTPFSRDIIENRLDEVHLAALQYAPIQLGIMNPDTTSAAIINTVHLPQVIADLFPGSTEEEQKEILHGYLANLMLKTAATEGQSAGPKIIENPQTFVNEIPGGVSTEAEVTQTPEGVIVVQDGSTAWLRLSNRFVDLDKLDIDLIYSINPFEHAYEILAKHLDEPTLKRIHESVVALRLPMTDAEAAAQFPYIKAFIDRENREPNQNAPSPVEQRLAQAWAIIKERRRKAQSVKSTGAI